MALGRRMGPKKRRRDLILLGVRKSFISRFYGELLTSPRKSP
jgi:hypothetical protein